MHREEHHSVEAEAILHAATIAIETETEIATGTGTGTGIATFETLHRFGETSTATGAAEIVWIVTSTPATLVSVVLGAHGLHHAIPATFVMPATLGPLGTAISSECAGIRGTV
jgi:hypothetical protein